MMLHSIRQASAVRPCVHSLPVAVPRQPLLRAGIRRQHTLAESRHTGWMQEQLTEWAKARLNAMTVDEARLDDAPQLTDTHLDPPWRTVLVPAARMDNLKHVDYPCAASSTLLWGIGPERPVANCNPHDVNPGAIDFERSSSRPGKGPFRHVARGAYGNRNFKYLWAIDHRGIHIAREMTPCKLSSRGIITHSILVDSGVVAGEIFFDQGDSGKVFINFGSARLPLAEVRQAEKTAEFVLALGYHTVVAMIPDRKLNDYPYGMADRYGSRVQNMVFKREEAL